MCRCEFEDLVTSHPSSLLNKSQTRAAAAAKVRRCTLAEPDRHHLKGPNIKLQRRARAARHHLQAAVVADRVLEKLVRSAERKPTALLSVA